MDRSKFDFRLPSPPRKRLVLKFPNYLRIRLLLVHNLDFSLIGQETKGYLELSHDWLPVWQCDFQSKKITRADEFDHGV